MCLVMEQHKENSSSESSVIWCCTNRLMLPSKAVVTVWSREFNLPGFKLCTRQSASNDWWLRFCYIRTEECFFIEWKGKKGTESFSQWKRCFHSLPTDLIRSLFHRHSPPMALFYWWSELFNLACDRGDEQMDRPITCQVFFKTRCPFPDSF